MLTRTLPLILLITAPGLAPAQDQDYRILGSLDAPVEMVIYSDFECPYCRNFALAALPAIIAEFVDTGRLRIRYAYFPLAAIHTNSLASSKAAHCAGVVGRFWSFHDYLFVRQPEWSGETVPNSLWVRFAENLGIDTDEFATCLASPEAHDAVEEDLREALGSGATGTPTVVLDGESVSGISSYETLRQEILSAIERAEGQTREPQ
jgi:protein-disulfide isomerase